MESKKTNRSTRNRTPAVSETGPVDRLRGRARELARASLSENTRLAYRGALQRLAGALGGHPATDAGVAAYLTSLHEGGKSPAVAAVAVAAVRFQARLMGQAPPIGPATERVLAGIRREGRERGRGQVSGINWNQADTVAAVAAGGGQSLAGLRDAAIVSLMSDALLRVGELAALQVEDIEAAEDGSGRLTIRHSKTDQEGAGAVQFIGAPTFRRVRAWMEGAGIESGPLFRRVRRGGRVTGSDPLTVPGHPADHQVPGRRRRSRGTILGPLDAGRGGSIAGLRRCFSGGDADRRPLAVALDAGPLCPGRAGRSWSRGPAPLRQVRAACARLPLAQPPADPRPFPRVCPLRPARSRSPARSGRCPKPTAPGCA